ncbi:DUF819 domain-containing protein [Flexithrix dorotheae]|uniref:DUF819 family protein n=1 Tax=Flexithrix dorotheae TaxID=70993 RepID=UPI000369853C|nr:DUF819 family protein [Flexithrix dorotheae]
MTSNPVFVLGILCLIIIISEWLTKKAYFRHFGTALMVILFGATFSNLGVIPSASNSIPLYSGIFKYLAPLSIFYLLLEVNLKSLKNAGLPMLFMFFVGVVGTVTGVLIGMQVVSGQEVFGENFRPLAGMFTGTYIGGSVNFNALALHYKIAEKGNVFAGAVAVDNIITSVWMIACIAIPKVLQRFVPRNKMIETEPEKESGIDMENYDNQMINSKNLAILLVLGLFTILVSDFLVEWINGLAGIKLPSILILTTIALIMAQIPFVHHLPGSRLLGLFSVYLFLVVIGAYCEFAALSQIGVLALNLLIFTLILVSIHGLLIFGIAWLAKMDWELAAIASQANIGGSSTALALSKGLNRNDLFLPSILVGALGNGVGTYLGFLIAATL